jgi:prepilin-type N-terminal cleavage/methylation domain-containing protein
MPLKNARMLTPGGCCNQDFRPAGHSNEGFTLIEVVLALSLLALICFGLFTGVSHTFKLRDDLRIESELNNSLVLALNLIQRDINNIYSPQLAAIPPPPPLTPPGGGAGTLAPQLQPPLPPPQLPQMGDLQIVTPYWGAAIEASGLRPSRFLGKATEMNFISLTHSRIYKEAPESEFCKISYELKSQDPDAEVPGTSALIRTESPNAFKISQFDSDLLETRAALLHGIRKFQIRYYEREGETWKTTNSWDTEQESTKNSFPEIIELTIEQVGPQNLSVEGVYQFRPEIPLNGLYPTN